MLKKFFYLLIAIISILGLSIFWFAYDGYKYEIISLGADGKIGGEGINADINSKDF